MVNMKYYTSVQNNTKEKYQCIAAPVLPKIRKNITGTPCKYILRRLTQIFFVSISKSSDTQRDMNGILVFKDPILYFTKKLEQNMSSAMPCTFRIMFLVNVGCGNLNASQLFCQHTFKRLFFFSFFLNRPKTSSSHSNILGSCEEVATKYRQASLKGTDPDKTKYCCPPAIFAAVTDIISSS